MSESYKTDGEVAASEHDSTHLEIGVGERAVPLVKAGPLALLVGLVLTGVSWGVMIAMPAYREAMMGGYLFGWYFTATLMLGMLAIATLHHTVRGSWSLPWIKLLHAGSSPLAMGVMLLLFLPMLVSPGTIYEWVDHPIAKKAWWLNQTGWTIRTFIYFAIFALMSWRLRASVARQEDGAPDGFRIEMRRSSMGAAFIVVYMLTITFAATDWAMSLQPHWYSTMFPLWQLIASCLGASGFVVALLCLNARKAPYDTVVAPAVTKDWGNILFMFTMLWAYTAVSQFLIIWNGNLPETASYYARRGLMGWNVVGMMIILGQFLLPWMTLLSPRIKRYPHLLRGVAGWILVIHAVDVYYAIVPTLPNNGWESGHGLYPGQHILFEALGLAAVFSVWLFAFARGVSATKSLLPTYDTRLQEALLHAH